MREAARGARDRGSPTCATPLSPASQPLVVMPENTRVLETSVGLHDGFDDAHERGDERVHELRHRS